jgi:enterochelin esterase-like enzyme
MDASSGSTVQGALKKYSTLLFATLVALLAVLLSSLLLTQTAINATLVATLAGLGLDPLRGLFVSSLLFTLLISLIAAFLSRLRLVVLLGALIFFSVSYFANFLWNVTRPLHDPGGLLEPLDKLALLHTTLIIFALVILTSCIGIALGLGLAHVLVDPLLRLASYLRHQRSELPLSPSPEVTSLSPPLSKKIPTRSQVVGGLAQALTLLAVLILATRSINLFVYGPDVSLHLSPALKGLNSSQNALVYDSYISLALHGQKRTFIVYLPPSYTMPSARTRRYPVLYLLHGSPGQQTNWMTGGKAGQSEDTLSSLGKAPELILVMPDGNGRGGTTSEWGNSGDGKQLLENALVDDLVPYVDYKYRTLADAAHRGIGGLSMGGFGAANIGIHHPDIFGFIIALGGYYHADGPIWGNNPSYLRANSPTDVLLTQKSAWYTHFYIGAATKDALYPDSVKFVHELKQLHIPYTFEVLPGYHAWPVWQVEFYHALKWLHTIIPLPRS